jgi:hypothetical protein
MHLKVLVKLKKTLKTLPSGQKTKKPKKTQKTKKKQKTQKKPLGWFFLKNPGFFQPWFLAPLDCSKIRALITYRKTAHTVHTIECKTLKRSPNLMSPVLKSTHLLYSSANKHKSPVTERKEKRGTGRDPLLKAAMWG